MIDYVLFKRHFESYLDDYKSVMGKLEELSSLFGGDFDSEFYKTIFKQQESYLDMLSELYDDTDTGGWLEWYVYENECGKAEMMAGKKGVARKIKSVTDLIFLMQQDAS